MPVVLRTDRAEEDLRAILSYLEELSPPAADRVAAAVEHRCALLADFPEIGRRRDELLPGLRSVVVEKAYVLFYRITPSAVEVVRILHGARDLEAILRAEPLD